MAFTEHQEHLIEINPPYYILTVEQADFVKKSGEEIGRQHTRFTYHPGDDISDAPADVQTVANAFWTQQVILEYLQSIPVEPNPYDQVTVTSVLGDNPAIYGGMAAPTADPNGVLSGWLYKNAGGGEKINLYLFAQDPADSDDTTYTLGEIETIYMKLSNVHNEVTRLPHIAVYTLPLGDGQDAQSWYRSRIVYEQLTLPDTLFDGTNPIIAYNGFVPQSDLSLQHIDLPIEATFSEGPQEDSERVTLIAVSTDSSAAAGVYDFALDELCVITSDNRQLVNVTVSQPN